MEAARQTARSIENLPDKTNVGLFIEKYLGRKRVGESARELGVSRVWVPLSYREEALWLTSGQFVSQASTKG